MILSDNETKVDFLNNEPIARTIVSLLRERAGQPITVGVHGDWGAGKSSVLEMVEAVLEADKDVLCLKFNGWRFQGFEDAKLALMEGVVEGLLEKRPFLTKATASVKEVFHRIDLLKLAKQTAGLVGAGAAFYAGHQQLGMMALASGLGTALTNPDNFSKEKLFEVMDGAKELLKEDKEHSSNVPEDITAFRKAFDQLLEDAKIHQLIVLIDDLDRCLPKTAIETLEAVRLFIFTARTAFVVAADEAMIEYAVREHFPDLPDTTGPQSYARAYLEKLIQVPFRIPTLGHTETRIYVTLLLLGAELGDSDPAFDRLLQEGKSHLKRPWLGGTLNVESMKAAANGDKDKEEKGKAALLISDQIAPVLAGGTRGNPRQVKRFLNTLLLRKASATARGFEEDVKLPVLAKLMLAERFNSRVFEQIAMSAASAPDGICPELEVLEATVHTSPETDPSAADDDGSAGGAKKHGRSPEPTKPETSTVAGEWISSEITRAWAKIQPPLAKLDLRPYLFVAKDRKDYFGAVTLLGQIAAIAEKLMGPKIVVQKEEQQLRQIAAPEGAQVFETLRAQILGTDSFKKPPKGVDGMEVLVRAQPQLQQNLLDFFEQLPASRLGSWVCRGWNNAIKDPAAVERYRGLIEGWAKSGSSELRLVAGTSMEVRPPGGR